MSLPRAVVLDFDGVVLESVDIKTRAFAALFADHPEHVDAIVRLHVANAGMSRFEKFRRIYRDMLERPLGPEEETSLGDRFSELVLDEIFRCPFVPGAREFLEWARMRHPLFLASGTPQEELRRIVEQRGLDHMFTGVYGTPRPKSEILADICQEIEAPSSELVFVGDAAADLEGAQAVGMQFVGRRTPGVPLPFPEAAAIVVVNDLAELAARWDELVEKLERLAAPTG